MAVVPKRVRPAIALLTASVVVLGSTTGGTRAAVETEPAAITWRTCRFVEAARCTTVTVPADPQRPRGARIPIHVELHPHTDDSESPVGTIVAVEGGPGYPSTESRDSYLDLFAPLLADHDLLLVDARGTGRSGGIDCPRLQLGIGDYEDEVGACGRQLGSRSDLYGTALAAIDLDRVLDALDIDTIDLYGDSYGTFFAQTFTIRYPSRVRTVVLDSAYPVENQDPWYRDTNETIRDAFRLVCARDPACAREGVDPIERIRDLARQLDRRPIVGVAPDADGVPRRMTIDASMLALIAAASTYGPTIYRELIAAMAAYEDRGLELPLLRLAAENYGDTSGGDVRYYSAGQYVGVICNDYPQLWDLTAKPGATRETQYQDAAAVLNREEPDAFDPFTIDQWVTAGWGEPRTCLQWPAPSRFVPPVEPGTPYPAVPVLVLSGELDSVTPPATARQVADSFPTATFVSIANGIHVMGLGDYGHCASRLIVRFVRSGGDAGNTACASDYPEPRGVRAFPRHWRAMPALETVPTFDRGREFGAVLATVGDVLNRWPNMYGDRGVGLRGGSFLVREFGDTTHFRLTRARFVSDVTVTGTVKWDHGSGDVAFKTRFAAAGSMRGNFDGGWRGRQPRATALVSVWTRSFLYQFTTPAP